MWWMWHGNVGHWVVNDSPGMHGVDLATSVFDNVYCPNEAVWSDSDGNSNTMRCEGEVATRSGDN